MNSYDTQWFNNYNLAKEYFEQNGNLLIPRKYKINNINLGFWIGTQRDLYKNKKLSKERIDLLNSIGMIWEVNNRNSYSWEQNYKFLEDYYKDKGNILIENTKKNHSLKIWLDYQRKLYRQNKLSKDKIELLEKLNIVWNIGKGNSNSKNGISSSWDDSYNIAKEYYEKNGNVDIPQKYKLENGFKLGIWINTQKQRIRYTEDNDINKKGYFLTEEQIKKLNSIGITGKKISSYQTSFPEQAISYYLSIYFKDIINRYRALGFELDIYIPSLKFAIEYDGQGYHSCKNRLDNDIKKNNLCIENGIKLLRIREFGLDKLEGCDIYIREDITDCCLEKTIKYIFSYIKDNFNKDYTDSINIDITRDIQIIMAHYKEYSDRIWNKYYEILENYYLENGICYVPSNYIDSETGLNLGNWVSHQRGMFFNPQNYDSRLSQTQIDKLNNIDFIWNIDEYKWNERYNELENYYLENGNIDLVYDYQKKDNSLACWLNLQKEKYSKRELDENKIKKLEELDINWKIISKNEDNWDYGYSRAKEYFELHGDLLCSKEYKTEDGFSLGYWLQVQRNGYNHIGKFVCPSDEHIELLNQLKMPWNGLVEYRWEKLIEELKIYIRNNSFPMDNNYVQNKYELGYNLQKEIKKYKCKKLDITKIIELNSVVGDIDLITFKKSKNTDLDLNANLSKKDKEWLSFFDLFFDVFDKESDYIELEDIELLNWFCYNKRKYLNNSLKPFQEAKFNSLGKNIDLIEVNTLNNLNWIQNFNKLISFDNKKLLKEKNSELYRWYLFNLKKYKDKTLKDFQMKKFSTLNKDFLIYMRRLS